MTAGAGIAAAAGAQAAGVELYDTHLHLFSNDVTRYPVDVRGARVGEDVLLKRVRTEAATPEAVMALWRTVGIVGGVAVQYNAVYKADNRFALDSIAAHPKSFAGVMMLPAADPGTPALLRRSAASHPVTGLRLFGGPDASGAFPWLDSDAALDTWAEVDRLGLTMVVMYAPATHADAALPRIAALADRFPGVRIALDHCGWPSVAGSADDALTVNHLALVKRPNISLKFTTINLNQFDHAKLPSSRFLRRAVDAFGADRLMWGSDFGNTQQALSIMTGRAIAATAELTAEERDKVLLRTGRSIFAQRAA